MSSSDQLRRHYRRGSCERLRYIGSKAILEFKKQASEYGEREQRKSFLDQGNTALKHFRELVHGFTSGKQGIKSKDIKGPHAWEHVPLPGRGS